MLLKRYESAGYAVGKPGTSSGTPLAEDSRPMSKIILCADDSVTMQTVAEITFRGTDYTYVGARSVEEALEKLKGGKPTLVLADAVMQGKSGYDLCLSIKSDAATADVPVVIMCGNAAPYDAVKGTSVGADATLPKPWDTQVMVEKCAEIIEKAKAGVAKPGNSAAPRPATAPAAAQVPASAVAAAAAGQAKQPQAQQGAPRSATIMGMPTIKMPAGAAGGIAQPVASTSASVAPAASAGPSIGGAGRSPMIAGVPTKRSQLMEHTLAKMSSRLSEASGLEAGSPELLALLKLSTEVVERIVWEVVPELAEQIIREQLAQRS